MKKKILILLFMSVIAVWFYLSSYPFGCGNREEIIIIGLDGGTWNVITPLVEKGELPNIKRIMETGTYGNLTSHGPLTPSVIWTSIATGKENISTKTKTVWEILSEKNKGIGTAYWTSAHATGLFMTPSEIDVDKEIYPKDLWNLAGKLLLKNPFLEFFWKTYYFKILVPVNTIDKDVLYDFYMLNYESREFFYLRDKFKPDVSAVVFYGSGRLQHYFWMYMEPEKFKGLSKDEIDKYGKVIEEYYKQFDDFIGRLRKCNEDATILIVSGYGFDASVPPKVVDKILVNKILEKADLLGLDYMGEIDFSRTKAYSSEKELEDEITIYVNAENEDEYEVIKNRVVDLFSDVYIEGIAQPISEISEAEEGVVLKRNVPMQLSGNILISGESYPLEEFVLRRVISGRPTKEGILIAGGGGIKKGNVIYNATVYDIAPTILYLSNIPVPKEMEGEVLREIIIAG